MKLALIKMIISRMKMRLMEVQTKMMNNLVMMVAQILNKKKVQVVTK